MIPQNFNRYSTSNSLVINGDGSGSFVSIGIKYYCLYPGHFNSPTTIQSVFLNSFSTTQTSFVMQCGNAATTGQLVTLFVSITPPLPRLQTLTLLLEDTTLLSVFPAFSPEVYEYETPEFYNHTMQIATTTQASLSTDYILDGSYVGSVFSVSLSTSRKILQVVVRNQVGETQVYSIKLRLHGKCLVLSFAVSVVSPCPSTYS